METEGPVTWLELNEVRAGWDQPVVTIDGEGAIHCVGHARGTTCGIGSRPEFRRAAFHCGGDGGRRAGRESRKGKTVVKQV